MGKIIMLEPSDSQEAKDMAVMGYELSERFDSPVMLRMTTRVCHSKSLVEFGEVQEQRKERIRQEPREVRPRPRHGQGHAHRR